MKALRTEIVQVSDAEAVAVRGCEIVIERARAAIAERGRFRLALSGGSTPKRLYALLGERDDVDFGAWQICFGDERGVAPDHPDSNFRMASEAWLARGRVPEANVHRIHGELDPSHAAAAYERELATVFGSREAPRFDLILLGLGADGHTASLFPGTSALDEARALVASTWVEKLGTHRVSLTLRALNAAHDVLFLVAGADKARALREVLRGTGDPRATPAKLVHPWDGRTTWLVDLAAASMLADDDA